MGSPNENRANGKQQPEIRTEIEQHKKNQSLLIDKEFVQKYTCEKCNSSFEAEKKDICKHCDTIFNNHSNNQFKCDNCDTSLTCQEKRNVKCKNCDKEISAYENRNIWGKKKDACEYCDITFKREKITPVVIVILIQTIKKNIMLQVKNL